MATKAAMMGDLEAFLAIKDARDPRSAKALGRKVRNFDEALWREHLIVIAYEVVRQKFQADLACRQVLLSTDDKILAEAALHDNIWGIGLSIGDEDRLSESMARTKYPWKSPYDGACIFPRWSCRSTSTPSTACSSRLPAFLLCSSCNCAASAA